MGKKMGKTNVEAKIAVIGTGREGCKVIDEFYWSMPEFDTIAIDSDESLSDISSDKRIVLQSNTADSKSFRKNDIRREVADLLHGYDIVYIITGLDGTASSIISPLVANIAISSGCMVASIAIKPSTSEAGNPSFDNSCAQALRTECPMTVIVDRNLVSKKIAAEDVQGAVNKSIIAYVKKHSDKLIDVFVKNLSKNVKDAFRTETQTNSSIFATPVSY